LESVETAPSYACMGNRSVRQVNAPASREGASDSVLARVANALDATYVRSAGSYPVSDGI